MIYEVKCTECGEIYEVSHRMSEDHPPCKECGGKLNTYFSRAPKFILKGDNWAGKDANEDYKIESVLRRGS